MKIHYEGIRLTPEQLIAAALRDDPHVIGLSILSGSHLPLVQQMLDLMRANGLVHIPLIVGGIIPEEDATRLRAAGVAAVYTPKDFELNRIMMDIVGLVGRELDAA
jgi:(2R)-ethylmalonyl-CoA mutase